MLALPQANEIMLTLSQANEILGQGYPTSENLARFPLAPIYRNCLLLTCAIRNTGRRSSMR